MRITEVSRVPGCMSQNHKGHLGRSSTHRPPLGILPGSLQLSHLGWSPSAFSPQTKTCCTHPWKPFGAAVRGAEANGYQSQTHCVRISSQLQVQGHPSWRLETGRGGGIYTISVYQECASCPGDSNVQRRLGTSPPAAPGNVTSQQNAQACLDLALAGLSRLTSQHAPRLGLQAARPECSSHTWSQGLHLHLGFSPRPALLAC